MEQPENPPSQSNHHYFLENEFLRIGFDGLGRIISFFSKVLDVEFLTFPDLEDNWRIMVLPGGYPVDYVAGKDQKPQTVLQGGSEITFRYGPLALGQETFDIEVDFTARLENGEAKFWLRVKNKTALRVREVWAPVLAGFQGFPQGDQRHRVDLARSGMLAQDILHTGLPGAEYLFCVEGETAEYRTTGSMQWLDLFSGNEGLYVGSHDQDLNLTAIKLEKHPSELGTSGGGYDERLFYPEATPRWLKISIGKLTTIDPGEEWTSPEAAFWPHHGDWHAAADHYRAWANTWMRFPDRPAWLDHYLGWQHLIGKTYLNELYHTFEQMTWIMKEGQKLTGVNVLMIYGHTAIGCEGANYDLGPGEALGGVEGYRRMCTELHQAGMKVIVFTHRQSAVAMDRVEEYQPYADWVMRDRIGGVRREVWWKTTIESLSQAALDHYEGTGPIWARVCPYCDAWWQTFLDEIKKLIDLGTDGIQLDTIGVEGGICYATNHGHRPGAYLMPKLRQRLEWLRAEVSRYAPDFLLCGEEFGEWMGQYLDLPYTRYREPDGYQVFRYTFPELKRNVAVGAYSYDQVNKGFMMGWGFNCEVEGLKKSILVCPELADYMGQVNQIRLKYADALLNGRYLDTLKAVVQGRVRYGVHQGPRGLAVVVWNSGDQAEECKITLDRSEGASKGILCRPGEAEIDVTVPCEVNIPAHRAITLIALSASDRA